MQVPERVKSAAYAVVISLIFAIAGLIVERVTNQPLLGLVAGALVGGLAVFLVQDPAERAAANQVVALEQQIDDLRKRPMPPDYTDPLVRLRADEVFRARGGHLK